MYKVIINNNKYEIENSGVSYKEGSEINSFIIYTDDLGRSYKKEVHGIIYQITKNLVCLINKEIKESYQIHELFHMNNTAKVNNIQLDLNSYSENIINDCILDLNKKGKGFVFSKNQLEIVYKKINKDIIECKFIDNMYLLTMNK